MVHFTHEKYLFTLFNIQDIYSGMIICYINHIERAVNQFTVIYAPFLFNLMIMFIVSTYIRSYI